MSEQELPPPSFLWGDAYADLPDDYDRFILQPLIPSAGLVNFYGKPKAGKSMAALGVGLAVSNGLSEWNGFKINRHGPVAYLQVDTPRGEWKARVQNLKRHGYDVSKMAVIDMEMTPYPFNILLPQHQAWLQRTLEQIQPVLLFVDTIREAHDADENDSGDMKRVVNALRKVSHPAAVVLISHARKDSAFNQSGGEDLMDDLRGTTYMSGRMDTIVKFTERRMTMKGRSIGQTTVSIEQDPETYLVHVKGEKDELEQLMLVVTQEMKLANPGVSRNAIAKELVKRSEGKKTARTFTRMLEQKNLP